MSLRPGVRAAYRVRRRLRLPPGQPGAAVALEYDAGHLQLDTLLSVLGEAGVDLDRGFGNRFRLGWYRFGDANVRAHSRDITSTCCSQPPLRHR